LLHSRSKIVIGKETEKKWKVQTNVGSFSGFRARQESDGVRANRSQRVRLFEKKGKKGLKLNFKGKFSLGTVLVLPRKSREWGDSKFREKKTRG